MWCFEKRAVFEKHVHTFSSHTSSYFFTRSAVTGGQAFKSGTAKCFAHFRVPQIRKAFVNKDGKRCFSKQNARRHLSKARRCRPGVTCILRLWPRKCPQRSHAYKGARLPRPRLRLPSAKGFTWSAISHTLLAVPGHRVHPSERGVPAKAHCA